MLRLSSSQSFLVDFCSPESEAERTAFRLVQVVASAYAAWPSWAWGTSLGGNARTVAPTGVGYLVPVEWMFGDSHAGPIVAGLTVVSLVAGVLDLRATRRWAYLVAFAGLSLLFAARFSQGKVSHGDNLMGFSILFLALGQAIYRDRFAARRFFWGFSRFYLGFLYVLSACSKLIATGFGWTQGQHLWMWIHERSIDVQSQVGARPDSALVQLLLHHEALATAFLSGGLLAEACGVLFWFRSTRTWITIVLLGMHVGIWFVLDISFFHHVVLLLLLGLPIDKWISRITSIVREQE